MLPGLRPPFGLNPFASPHPMRYPHLCGTYIGCNPCMTPCFLEHTLSNVAAIRMADAFRIFNNSRRLSFGGSGQAYQGQDRECTRNGWELGQRVICNLHRAPPHRSRGPHWREGTNALHSADSSQQNLLHVPLQGNCSGALRRTIWIVRIFLAAELVPCCVWNSGPGISFTLNQHHTPVRTTDEEGRCCGSVVTQRRYCTTMQAARWITTVPLCKMAPQ